MPLQRPAQRIRVPEAKRQSCELNLECNESRERSYSLNGLMLFLSHLDGARWYASSFSITTRWKLATEQLEEGLRMLGYMLSKCRIRCGKLLHKGLNEGRILLYQLTNLLE